MTVSVPYAPRPRAERLAADSLGRLLIKDKVSVNYAGLNESAIVLEITCWFESSDSNQYAGARHALLLAVLEVVEFFNAFAPPKK